MNIERLNQIEEIYYAALETVPAKRESFLAEHCDTDVGLRRELSLELVDAGSENVIWSQQYNRRQIDLVSLQSQIARDVSEKLQIKISGAEAAQVAKTSTTDPDAYQAYLKGRFYWNRRTSDVVLRNLGYAYGVVGRRAEAAAIARELEEKYAKKQALGQYIAAVYAGLGDKDKVFEWLEKDFQNNEGIAGIRWSPQFQFILDDPRYKDLLKRMNLPE